jgi:hypothetical protein
MSLRVCVKVPLATSINVPRSALARIVFDDRALRVIWLKAVTSIRSAPALSATASPKKLMRLRGATVTPVPF